MTKSIQIDFNDRNGALVQGISVNNWLQLNYTVYLVASVKVNTDGTQYPWISAYNVTDQNMKFHMCLNSGLIGQFNKHSNRNFALASIGCPDCNESFRAAIRSQRYGGI